MCLNYFTFIRLDLQTFAEKSYKPKSNKGIKLIEMYAPSGMTLVDDVYIKGKFLWHTKSIG